MIKHIRTLALLIALSACGVNSHMTAKGGAKIEEIWQEPSDIAQRDLFYGAGGRELAPDPATHFEVTGVKTTGTQPGYDVKDAKGDAWSVKLGIESRIEVTVSRIVWAIGFHQPPTYYMPKWTRVENGKTIQDQPARFRYEPKWLDKEGEWSWRDNPFVGTRPLAGLWTLMVMFNNWDIKKAQNTVYKVERPGTPPQTWYVARDLGASLGKTAWIRMATKGDTAGFAKEPFIEGVEGNRVQFHYEGAWLEPKVHDIATPADVRWVCDLLARLSPQQWQDAFRAGGFSEQEAKPFIDRMQEKIAEGRALRWY